MFLNQLSRQIAGLMRWNSIIVWQNYSANTGEISSEVDVLKVEFLLIYVSC